MSAPGAGTSQRHCAATCCTSRMQTVPPPAASAACRGPEASRYEVASRSADVRRAELLFTRARAPTPREPRSRTPDRSRTLDVCCHMSPGRAGHQGEGFSPSLADDGLDLRCVEA
eukprot:28218-Prymnesium_polylepis.1